MNAAVHHDPEHGRGPAFSGSKLIEAYAVDEDGRLVMTIVVKFSQDTVP